MWKNVFARLHLKCLWSDVDIQLQSYDGGGGCCSCRWWWDCHYLPDCCCCFLGLSNGRVVALQQGQKCYRVFHLMHVKTASEAQTNRASNKLCCAQWVIGCSHTYTMPQNLLYRQAQEEAQLSFCLILHPQASSTIISSAVVELQKQQLAVTHMHGCMRFSI